MKTYKLTGAGWAETNDTGITWATQSAFTTQFSTAGWSSTGYTTGMGDHGQWWIQQITLNDGAHDTGVNTTFGLNPNGEVAVISGNKTSANANGTLYAQPQYETISLKTDFVTQIGTKVVRDDSASIGWAGNMFLYVKARPRTAAELGATVTSMPQSGDPAANWTQNIAYLSAIVAMGCAVVVTLKSRKRL